MTWKVSYDGNGNTGGSAPEDTIPYLSNASVTVLANPGFLVREGYSFSGWNTLADGTGLDRNPGSVFQITGDTTLFAHWTGLVYTVSFDSQGADSAASPETRSVTVPATTVSALPLAPSRTGYTFGGWYTSTDGGGTEFTASTPVTGSVTVFAKWTINSYSVTYLANGGTGSVSSQSGTYGSKVTAKSSSGMARTGYTFAGWATSGTGPVQYATGAQITLGAGDLTLYAVWTGNNYLLMFHPGSMGMGSMTNQTIACGSTVSLDACSFYRNDGYEFQGWASSLERSNAGIVDFTDKQLFTMGPTNQFIYAVWGIRKRKMISVTGGTFNNGTANITVSDFRIANIETTRLEYRTVMGLNPLLYNRNEYPVDTISWYAALVFCNKLSMNEGRAPVYTIKGSTNPADWGTVPTVSDAAWDAVTMDMSDNGYRLPTESEWEWAARGGILSQGFAFAGNINPAFVAVYEGYGDVPVATKLPNELGLYDMCGNVSEFCWDFNAAYTSGDKTDPTGPTSGTARIIRGGNALSPSNSIKVNARDSTAPTTANLYGIRVVCRS